MPKLNPYIRIINAAKRGVGVTLTAREVYFMAFDDTISVTAQNTLDGEEVNGGFYQITKEGFVEE